MKRRILRKGNIVNKETGRERKREWKGKRE